MPRNTSTYQASKALLRAAESLQVIKPNWSEEIQELPPSLVTTKVVSGPIASGEKIIDSLSNEFVNSILSKWTKLLAFQTESVGAAQPIHSARDRFDNASFLMIRGISDTPIDNPNLIHNEILEQTKERDTWKNFASSAAASYSIQTIKHVWPVPPIPR